ncbi:MAG: patatin-like phospholipase family protein [Betaproteobacteria bacterium]|nr:patatin-like phospholipase family protein [Betaproteobacteria bacterium]
MNYKCRRGSGTGGGRLSHSRTIRGLAAGIAMVTAVLLPGSSHACRDVPDPPRPRIGLVLSGGGALGLAHVGVLRVIEELRIPVDCIAGTSMGAIVGAAYASGMTPEEMERRLRETQWDRVFRDAPARSEQSLLHKQLDSVGLWSLELGVSRGLPVLPKGAISGQQMLATLRSFVQEPANGDFDRLPIPFRAVATDIETGEAVVLSRGDLARAMRASMSVPGIVSPEEIDGRVLLDGGLVRNLPVDVVRAMGADIVIAVNLGTKLLKREELQSVLGVSVQMINILTEQNVRRSLSELRQGDLLVEPDLAGFSALEFARAKDIIPRGEAAARRHADFLQRLSMRAQDYEAYRLAQVDRARVSAAARRLAVDTSGLKFVNPQAVEASIRTEEGTIPSDEKLVGRVARLFGRGDLDRVDYHFVDRDGERTLVVETRDKARGPNYVRVGLALSSDFEGEGRFSLRLFHAMTWLNRLGGEWRNRLQLGFNPSLVSEFHQPLDLRGRWFVAPRVEISQSVFDLYAGETRVAQYQVRRAGIGLDAGASLDQWGEIRAGVYRGSASATPSVALPLFSPLDAEVGNVSLRGHYDTLDNINFPGQGTIATAGILRSLAALGADRQYVRADLDAAHAFGYRNHQFLVGLRGGKALSGSLPFHDVYGLGGLFNLSGHQIGRYVGESFAIGRVIYWHRLDRIPAFADGLYWGGSLEAGNMYKRLDSSPDARGLIVAASLFLAADTALGPVYLAWGHAETGPDALYLFLGRP